MTGAWAVVLAAGSGTRFSSERDKLLCPLNGGSVLETALDALAASGEFDGAVLVEKDGVQNAHPFARLHALGGSTRQESARNGLAALPDEARYVAIHDAARPFVAPAIISAALKSARLYGSGVPATPVTDTIKLVDGEGRAISTPPRDRLRAVQTPQAFERGAITRAHEAARADGFEATDDCALYEKYIGPARVFTLPECADNIKITTPRDLPQRAPRCGIGYDAHRLVEGRLLTLCGAVVPFEKGLLGHSDADAPLHAIIDALLGAAGLGDIGLHFPDSDQRYKDISSLKLLERTAELLKEGGWTVGNVDVTIVCQRPKLRPYAEVMARNIADALNVEVKCVNVKAKTTEGMGFEGEGLGISATATALIR